MIKIELIENRVLTFSENGNVVFSCIEKPSITSDGYNIKIVARDMAGFFKTRKPYYEFEINGTIPTDAGIAMSALFDLCSVFKKGGGVTPPSPPTIGGFKPHPDWWNIEKIFKDDTDPNKRFILLLNDSLPTFVFNTAQLGATGAYYKTSDGATYNGNVTHTWDTSQDKTCSDGYKTRWVMVYSANATIVCNVANATNKSCMYAYFGNSCVVNSIAFGANSTVLVNYLLKYVHFEENVKFSSGAIGSNAFAYCYSLQIINIPSGVTSMGLGAFSSCSSLQIISIPSGVTSMGNNVFQGCSSLQIINIPSGITSMGSNVFNNCNSLQIINIPSGFTFPSTQTFFASEIMSISGLRTLSNNIGYHTTGRILTFSSQIKTTLQLPENADILSVFTSKNITIA